MTVQRAAGVEAPPYLDGSLPADYGWDPLGLGADSARLTWCALCTAGDGMPQLPSRLVSQ